MKDNSRVEICTERTGSLYRVTAEAPYGRVWVAGHVHELVAEGRGPDSREARADVRARMRLGTLACDEPECAWCNPDDTHDGEA